MEIISFTMNLARQRLDVRYDDNTEKCIRYRDLYSKLKKSVKATDKQVDTFIAGEVKVINESDLDDKEKKIRVARMQATTERGRARVFVENQMSADAADVEAKKIVAGIDKKMRTLIQEVVDGRNR